MHGAETHCYLTRAFTRSMKARVLAGGAIFPGYAAYKNMWRIAQPGTRRTRRSHVCAGRPRARQSGADTGFSASGADQIAEMSAAFSARLLSGEYENGPTEIAPTTLERFAGTVFKPAYEAGV